MQTRAEFEFALTCDETGETIPVALDLATALKLWEDLGRALDAFADANPHILQRGTGDPPADGSRVVEASLSH